MSNSDRPFQPLSNQQIEQLASFFGHPLHFIQYHQLKDVDQLRPLLPCLLLYELNYPIGHWVLLFENHQGINYFDSTGRRPDDLLVTSFHHPAGRESLNADFTYLNQLLSQMNCPIIYNDFPLQPPETSTCGAWVLVRLLSSDIPNDQFVELFKPFDADQRQIKISRIYRFLERLYLNKNL